jgi:16S rRNA pseudouridine516 synthase
MINLERLLARNLPCSRKEARRLLGEATEDLPRELSPDLLPCRIVVAGQSLELHDSFHLMLNKPAGCVTALTDPSHDTAAACIHGAPLFSELRPVGRLDLDTTGLLLWTTDGTWLHRLTHPKNEIPRTYHAALERPFQPLPPDLVLRDGHQPNVLDLRPLQPSETHSSLLKPASANNFATITIAGGAYHEIRRIFAALGSHVSALCRVSYGALQLPRDLAAGRWQQVTQGEVLGDQAHQDVSINRGPSPAERASPPARRDERA